MGGGVPALPPLWAERGPNIVGDGSGQAGAGPPPREVGRGDPPRLAAGPESRLRTLLSER